MTQVGTECQLDPGLRRDDEKNKAAMTRGVLFLPCGEGNPQGGGGAYPYGWRVVIPRYRAPWNFVQMDAHARKYHLFPPY